MANQKFRRISKLEVARAIFTGSFDRDLATMSDAQLISFIESADPEILARWPDWISKTLDAKMAALVEAYSAEVQA